MFDDWDTAFELDEAFDPETFAWFTWLEVATVALEEAVDDEHGITPLPMVLLAPALLWWDEDEADVNPLGPPVPTPPNETKSSSISDERAPPGVAGAVVPPPTPELDFLMYDGLRMISSSIWDIWLFKLIHELTWFSNIDNILTESNFSGLASNWTIPKS